MKPSRNWIDWERPVHARPPDHAVQQHFSPFYLEGKLGSDAVCRPPTWLSPALTAHPLLTGAMTSQQPAQPLCPAIAVIDQNGRRPACCS
jgi:hypothetical protein